MKLKRTDTTKVEGGAWVGDLPDMGNLRLHVKGINNVRFRRLQQQMIAAVPRAERHKGRIDPVTLDRINGQCMASTVLLGWENLEGEDGQPVPFSVEQARSYLTDPEYRAFFDATTYAATIVGDDEADTAKEDEGNFSTASAGG